MVEQGFPAGRVSQSQSAIFVWIPETASEKVYSKIDKKLKQKREKTKSNQRIGWFRRSRPIWNRLIRDGIYQRTTSFLLKASPVIADLKMKDMVPLLYMEPIISLIKYQDLVTVIIRLKKNIDSWNKRLSCDCGPEC